MTTLNIVQVLVEKFFYSKEEAERVVAASCGQKWNGFALDGEGRHWISLREESLPMIDQGWARFKDLVVDEYSYEEYRSGRTESGAKLYKKLLKEGALDQDQVDGLNALRLPPEHLFLCISRNIVDFMFCATEQNFSSCLSAGHRLGYWFSVPGMMLDENRAVVFITTKNRRISSRFGADVEFYDMIQRHWIVSLDSPDGEFLYLDNAYPSTKIDICSIIDAADVLPEEYHGKPWKPVCFPDRQTAMIHMDTLSVYVEQDGSFSYGRGEMAAEPPKFNGEMQTFGEISNVCNKCGKERPEHVFDGKRYCTTCCPGIECHHCSRHCNGSDMVKTHSGLVCSECIDGLYSKCSDCGQWIHWRDRKSGLNSSSLCSDCYKKQGLINCRGGRQCGTKVEYMDGMCYTCVELYTRPRP